jgi:anthranilate synthase/aminodeoxychorismate synthase-like glutamine amidotransferase
MNLAMKVLVLDNYDSFTWNLVQAIEASGAQCLVHRSDRIGLEEIEDVEPDRIVLSPGPFGPDKAGVCGDVIRRFMKRVPILGVCLGMQVIATVAGAAVVPSGRPVHGRTSAVTHDGRGVLRGLPNPFRAARYHSLVVLPSSVPPCLELTAWTEDGIIMGCRMRGQCVDGVLFHPESFLTECGPDLILNFLES